MPNTLLDGRQISPRRKFLMPISLIAGSPFANKKMHINKTETIEIQAVKKNSPCMIFSFL
jgi:hypothetical protein